MKSMGKECSFAVCHGRIMQYDRDTDDQRTEQGRLGGQGGSMSVTTGVTLC